MTTLESVIIWLAIGGYAVAFALELAGFVFKKDRLRAYGFGLAAAALAFHTLGFAVRWWLSGHIPVMGSYENSLVSTWVIMAIYFSLCRFFPPSRPFSVVIIPVVLLMLGNGLMVGSDIHPLEPPFRSNWLYIHIMFSWFAFAPWVAAFAAGLMYLVKDRPETAIEGRTHELKLLEELSLRLILFGFFADAIGVGSGAIWAKSLWGRYWSWDPLETWALITWLIYGLNLHLRLTYGWRGRKAAWLAVLSLCCVGISFSVGFVSVHTGIL